MQQTQRFAAAAVAVLTGILIAIWTPGFASAAPMSDCPDLQQYSSMKNPTPSDSGGKDAWIYFRCNGTVMYKVNFNAYGEELRLEDRWVDGYKARAIVKVHNTAGTLVDTDTFINAGTVTYDLGTPDGEGDIPEGYSVYIWLCIEYVTCGWGQANAIA